MTARIKENQQMTLQLKARAKINLGLDVLRRREDGYHDLRMIMQTIDLCDTVLLERTREAGISLKTNLPFLPSDENNLAYRAAALLLNEKETEGGLSVELKKHIPVAAGLAGGSSDAAAVLVGVNRLFSLGYSKEELMVKGKALGADVPYCIMRGTALAEGIGEVLTPLPAMPPCHIVLAKPQAHISTRFVYTNLKANELSRHPDIDLQVRALREGDLRLLAQSMENVLETVTVPECPVIEEIKNEMRENGALGAVMSGSGPSVFGVFEEEEKAQAVRELLREKYALRAVFVTRPC